MKKMKELHADASYLNTADYNKLIKEQVVRYTKVFESIGARQ